MAGPVAVVRPLTPEAFAPYGSVIQVPPEHQAGGWDELPFPIRLAAEAGFAKVEGELQFLAVTLAERALEVGYIERHLATAEIVIPLGQPLWLPVAAPTEAAAPDPAAVCVFALQPTQAVILLPGTWHFAPFVTRPGAVASLLAIYRRGTMESDMQLIPLQPPVPVAAGT
ncbi:MAG: ureidoglycolate lyase [Anaerolineales bacterium]|nr:ureidoglycolate lyase [Anaerolineales bacterium]